MIGSQKDAFWAPVRQEVVILWFGHCVKLAPKPGALPGGLVQTSSFKFLILVKVTVRFIWAPVSGVISSLPPLLAITRPGDTSE